MFVMDPIARFIYTALFLIIVSGLTYFGVRVYLLKSEIVELNSTIVELKQDFESCKSSSAKLESSNTFLKQNLNRLNAYYKQKPKPPVVSGGTFNVDNLFMASPR
jgi:hypothetical protein